jgi:hypothetical protein
MFVSESSILPIKLFAMDASATNPQAVNMDMFDDD